MANTGTLQNNLGIFAPLCNKAQQQIDTILHTHEQLFLGDQDEDTADATNNAVPLETLLGEQSDTLAPEDCYVRIMERRPKARALPALDPNQTAHIADLITTLQKQATEFAGVVFRAAVQAGAYLVDHYARFAAWIETTEARLEERVAQARATTAIYNPLAPALALETATHTEESTARTSMTTLEGAESTPRVVPTYAEHYAHMRTPVPTHAQLHEQHQNQYQTIDAYDPGPTAGTEPVPSAWSYAMQSLKRDLLGKGWL